MSNSIQHSEQGHWLLAKMGKRVLRPGGKELSLKLIRGLNIQTTDHVVEFAPGMGFTASILLEHQPEKYTGVELNEEAAKLLNTKFKNSNRTIINKSAADTGLEDASVDIVIGEAMLTMQADHRKTEIIKEAYRILKKGGQYGIHELGLYPDEISGELKKEVQQGLAKSIKVNARPLTKTEWCALLTEVGFKIKKIEQSPMDLLKWKRIIADEGLFRTIKIAWNILNHPVEKKKILDMKNTFKKYDSSMTSYAIIAEK